MQFLTTVFIKSVIQMIPFFFGSQIGLNEIKIKSEKFCPSLKPVLISISVKKFVQMLFYTSFKEMKRFTVQKWIANISKTLNLIFKKKKVHLSLELINEIGIYFCIRFKLQPMTLQSFSCVSFHVAVQYVLGICCILLVCCSKMKWLAWLAFIFKHLLGLSVNACLDK